MVNTELTLLTKMAVKLALFSPTTTFLSPSTPLPPPYPSSFTSISHKRRPHSFKIHADLGGGDGEGSGKKKFITREQEPEKYWQTAGEREGENPMMTPLPYIIIFGMPTPLVILAIGFTNGWIKGTSSVITDCEQLQPEEQQSATRVFKPFEFSNVLHA